MAYVPISHATGSTGRYGRRTSIGTGGALSKTQGASTSPVQSPGHGIGTLRGSNRLIPANGTLDIPYVFDSLVGTLDRAQVALYALHAHVEQLEVRLVAPDGTTYVTSLPTGIVATSIGSANQLATFDDDATASIDTAAAPIAGPYKPHQPFTTFGAIAPNGTWKLRIINSGATEGSVEAAALFIGTSEDVTLIGGGGGGGPAYYPNLVSHLGLH